MNLFDLVEEFRSICEDIENTTSKAEINDLTMYRETVLYNIEEAVKRLKEEIKDV